MTRYNVSKKVFFNNLNSELNEYFYDDIIEDNKNVIDYDVTDYDEYDFFEDELKRLNIKVKMDVRIVTINNKEISSTNKTLNLVLVRNEILKDPEHPGVTVIKCHGCGASVDIMKEKCNYCGAKVHYLQSWYIKRWF